MLILTEWHGLSVFEMEILAIERLPLWIFPGYPDTVPDPLAIWLGKMILADNEKLHLIG